MTSPADLRTAKADALLAMPAPDQVSEPAVSDDNAGPPVVVEPVRPRPAPNPLQGAQGDPGPALITRDQKITALVEQADVVNAYAARYRI